jgi:rfaE bifunctional protein kinase chain/domain
MVDLQVWNQKLAADLKQLEGKKVFIFGDVGIDEYVNGEVKRISPEAPVPVVEVFDRFKKLGLSGNVAANVKSLGGEPFLCSLVGEDQNGAHLQNLLSEKGISCDFLMKDPTRETTAKMRVMSGQHHVVRVDYESRAPMKAETLKQHQSLMKEGIENSDVIILQDYAKGQIGADSSQWVIQTAREMGKKVIVDPYRTTPLSYYKGAQFMTPNRDEAFDLAKQIPKPEIWKDVDQIGPELMKQTESPEMVITLGAEGVKVFKGQERLHLPTFARTVFDVTGAGDTVIAAFSLGLAAHWEIDQSAFLANMAAGVVVGQIGAVACTQSDLLEYLKQHEA